MKRLIVDYKNLDKKILNLLVEKFPDGYDKEDIISFRNSKNEMVEAVEVRTDDTIYLVKVGLRLVKAMEDMEQENEDDDENDDDTSNMDFNDGMEDDGYDNE